MEIFFTIRGLFFSSSGRTSRLEIRKLLWECLFWRFKRTQAKQNQVKYSGNSFVFNDDDDDTERSIQAQGTTSYSALTVQLSNRKNNLSPQLSSGNYSVQTSQISNTSSVFTCCGFSIDLSNKHSHPSTSKSLFDESSSHRSIGYKNPNPLLSKTASYPQSPVPSSNDRLLRPQRTVCYRSHNTNRPINRRRATTLVHCSRKKPTSINTKLTGTLSSPVHRSISKEKQCLTFEKVQPIIDIPLKTKDGYKTTINITEPPIIVQTDCNELLLPAYIIETC